MANILKALIEISAIAGIMILIVMGLRALFAKKMSPGVVTLLWAFVLLRLVMPFTLQSPVQLAQFIPQKPAVEAQNTTEADSAVPYTQQDTQTFLQPNVYSEPAQAQTTLPEMMLEQTKPTLWKQLGTFIQGISWWNAFTGVWVTGAFAVVLLTLWRAILYKRKLNNCKRVTDGKIIEMVKEYKQSLGIKRRVSVTLCNDGAVPAVFGYFRPHIVLPASFVSNMDKSALGCILLHELCHIKRHDILKSYIWLIAKAIHWFNPLVWMAYKMLKDDMELCCDQMVVKELGNNRFEYTQSLIDVFRHAKQRNAFAVTLSLFENRIKLIDRVMRMLKPEKKSKLGFALTIMLILVMTLTCFTTACQPITNTEETAAVEEAAKTPEEVTQTQTPETEAASTQEPQEEMPLAIYSVTGRWIDSVEREDSIIKLNIDADIMMPDVDTVNTYYVNPTGTITQEMTDRILEVLFGDTPLYEYQERTKESYQKEIDQINNIYQSMLDGTFDFSDYASEEEAIKSAEEHIAQLEKSMKDAPESVEQIPLNTTLTFSEYGEATIRGVADFDKEKMAQIIINSYKYGSNLVYLGAGQYYYYGPQEEPSEVLISNLTITAQDAIKRAEQFLEDIGLDDYQLYDNYITQGHNSFYKLDTGKYAHVLEYTRVVDGIEVSQSAYIPFLDSMNCNSERFAIAINDDGICWIDWQHGFALEQKASQNEKLLPIEEIESIIADKMFIEEPLIRRMNEESMGIPGFKVQEYTYNIDHIRLEYMKLPYGDDFEDIRLIPVWSVFASIEIKYSKDENGERVDDVIASGNSGAVLTINAIDGSLIDKELWANRDFY